MGRVEKLSMGVPKTRAEQGGPIRGLIPQGGGETPSGKYWERTLAPWASISLSAEWG